MLQIFRDMYNIELYTHKKDSCNNILAPKLLANQNKDENRKMKLSSEIILHVYRNNKYR